MEPEEIVETPVEDVETVESTGPARDEQGRFASGNSEPTDEQPIEDGDEIEAQAPVDPNAEAETAVQSWKPFALKLHGEEKPLDWAHYLDGDDGGVYILPTDLPKFHQMAGLAAQYEKKSAELTQQRRQVQDLHRQLEARSKTTTPEVAAATHLVERIQKLSAMDAQEVEQFNRDPELYFKLLVRDALDRSKDAQLQAYEQAKTESTQQWEQEDTDSLQTDQLTAWVFHLRDQVPELKSLSDEQLTAFLDDVMPTKASYFVTQEGELRVRNDVLARQLQSRAKLVTEAQTRAMAAAKAKAQNAKVLTKGSTPPTVPAKGSAVASEAQKKPKSRDEWRSRVGVA